MKVSGNGGTYQNPKPGMVSAVCTRVIDMGTQDSAQFGKKRKVMLGWEISQLMEDGRPFQVNKRYTASIHPKATLGIDLESWRGRAFKDEERKSFNLETILGKSCLLNLVQEGDYVNVKSITPLVAGMAPLQMQGSLVHLSLDEFNQSTFDGLSDSLRETIAKSPEYAKATGAAPQHHDEGQDGAFAGVPADDIPF